MTLTTNGAKFKKNQARKATLCCLIIQDTAAAVALSFSCPGYSMSAVSGSTR